MAEENGNGTEDSGAMRDVPVGSQEIALQEREDEAQAKAPALPESDGAGPAKEAPPAPPKKGALHIERGHLEIRLTEHSYHEIRLADLSAKGDTTGLLLYAMVLQLFDVTRGLAAVAHNAGAGAQLLAKIEAAGRQQSAQDATALAARTMDQLFDTFERRTGHKINR
jgi:hypothetical protein